ncbi:MAG TPA: hypothetical protein VFR76_08230 [Verrucomicrobiae bacterium]|nr:hypothetical protein [Verrucomicrobiae bacterium]
MFLKENRLEKRSSHIASPDQEPDGESWIGPIRLIMARTMTKPSGCKSPAMGCDGSQTLLPIDSGGGFRRLWRRYGENPKGFAFGF